MDPQRKIERIATCRIIGALIFSSNMRNRFVFVLVAASVLLLSGCSTNYYSYEGGGVLVGQGGASKRVNGIDIWTIGAPARRYRIIGYITDSRPEEFVQIGGRDSSLAKLARDHGGDGILIHSDASRYTGTTTTTVVDSTYKEKKSGKKKNGSSSTFVTETSEDQYQREGRFYVIKYL
jgi:hypothetical protein